MYKKSTVSFSFVFPMFTENRNNFLFFLQKWKIQILADDIRSIIKTKLKMELYEHETNIIILAGIENTVKNDNTLPSSRIASRITLTASN